MGLLGNLFGSTGSINESPTYSNRDAEKQQRLENYKKTWEAYLAELPDPLAIDGPSNDNVKVNLARAIVNTGVYFLFGNEIKFQVSPDAASNFGDTATNAGANTAGMPTPKYVQDLNKAWKANRKASFLYNLGISGSIHGTCFVKIIPNAAGLNNEYPRYMIIDPSNMDVEWDPNDCTKVLKYLIEYVTENEKGEPEMRIQEIRANQDSDGRIHSWTMQDYKQKLNHMVGVGWVPMSDEDRIPVGQPTEWPYAWAPIEHCQNIELPHMFWGLSDLDQSSVEVIESLQRSMSSLNKIVRIHASPRMFAKNVMPDQVEDIDISPDNIITLPNMEAELGVLETLSNLSPSIQYAEKQRSMLLEQVQVPPIALGEFNTAGSTISGVSLSILYAPILQKTELKRISYGDMIDRLNAKTLILMGHEPDSFESLVLVWPECMPGSVYLERQTLQQDHQMGTSSYTIQSKLGYDPVEEEKRRIDERSRELEAISQIEAKYGLNSQSSFNVGGTPQTGGTKIGLSSPQGGSETRGGNNNPSGYGNKNGSMGGTKAAGTPKTPKGDK